MRKLGRVVDVRGDDSTMGGWVVVLTDNGVVQVPRGELQHEFTVGDLVSGPPWVRLARPSGVTTRSMGDAYRWLVPQATGESRLRILKLRQRMALAVRQWFFDQDFLEVPSPVWVSGTCPDLAIDSVEVGDRVLCTSTEYQLKRLVVGGCPRIMSFGPNFRAGEISATHNPEFTMVEWARVGEPMEKIEEDACGLMLAALNVISPGATTIRFGQHDVDLTWPWERLTVRDAWRRYLGIVVDGPFGLAEIRQAVRDAQLRVPEVFLEDIGDLISYLIDAVQPFLGHKVPTILVDWPALMTSSAALSEHNTTVAQRSEIFVAGMELSDGFPFMTDAEQQRQGFYAQQRRRQQANKPEVLLDERYLVALDEGLPPGAGMALGFDRLVMVLLGQNDIRNVIPFAWDEC